jgi:endoglucanase
MKGRDTMEKFDGFQNGVNLGGWISQYEKFDPAHFQSFITQSDIRKIASWGMDHVRLPFDYPILEDDAHPFIYKEAGFGYLDRCIEWCRVAGLNLILDMHRAPGYSFNSLADNNLFANDRLQERYLSLWENIARRYGGTSRPKLVLELMNEIVLPTSEPWNSLAQKAVERIRKVDSSVWIMIGGNHYNSAWTLKEIRRINDPHIVYTFHDYEPMLFTHQRAPWVEFLKGFAPAVEYPASVPALKEYLDQNPQFAGELQKFITTPLDINYLRAMLQPAVDFLNTTHLPLYCGEYGAIDVAPLPARLNWHRDFVALLREHGIGRAVWSYKEMNFALVRKDGSAVSDELIQIVSAK